MRRLASCAPSSSASRDAPSPTNTWPRSAPISPQSIATVVDLPAPFGPSRPTISPAPTSSDRSATTVRSPYDLQRPRASRIAALPDRNERDSSEPDAGREPPSDRSTAARRQRPRRGVNGPGARALGCHPSTSLSLAAPRRPLLQSAGRRPTCSRCSAVRRIRRRARRRTLAHPFLKALSMNSADSAAASDPLRAHSDRIAGLVEQVGAATVAVLGRRGAIASGCVWRPGLVVTAAHVFRRAPAAITLVDAGARHLPATLVGLDSATDLALFRVVEADAPAAIAASDGAPVRAGHLVIAVGRGEDGDTLASSGLVNRVGVAWQTWLGGSIDRLIRLDGGIYDGLSG